MISETSGMTSKKNTIIDKHDLFFDRAREIFEPSDPVLRFRYYDRGHQPETHVAHPNDRKPQVRLPEEMKVDQPVNKSVANANKKSGCSSRRRLSQIEESTLLIDRFIQLPFADGSAGTIICEDTLPYVESAEIALKEMKRVLDDDGMLFLKIQADLADDEPWLWRPTPQGLVRLLNIFDASITAWRGPKVSPTKPKVLYAVAAGQRSAGFLGQRAGRFIKYMQQGTPNDEKIDFLVDAPSDRLDWLFD